MTKTLADIQQRIIEKARRTAIEYAQSIPTHLVRDEVVGLAAAQEMAILIRERIQEQCGMCDGHGFTIEIGTESGHACDGTEASCLQNCPVPIPVQVHEQCEYCGRPNGVIDDLLASLPSPPETP